LPESEHVAQIERLSAFQGWVENTPGLESIAVEQDFVWAVAQHYGLPTHFVDFTTDPVAAAFFASQPSEAPGDEACIICLDSAELIEFWEDMASLPKFADDPAPRVLRLDVPNLWRLEAQSGVSLFLPYVGFERLFDMDRIVFPIQSKPTFDAHVFYPVQKSDLERLLDQYFMIERLNKGRKTWEEMDTSAVHTIRFDDKDVDDEVLNGPLPEHPSWAAASEQTWLEGRLAPEPYKAGPDVFDIETFFESDGRFAYQRSLSSLLLAFENGSLDRARRTELRVLARGRPAICDELQRFWDGTRRLPYRSLDLAHGVVGLINYFFDSAAMSEVAAEIAHVEISLGLPYGSYSGAYVSRRGLMAMVRDDIAKYLSDGYRDRLLSNPRGLIQTIRNPRKLFDLDRLVAIFVREILPTQELVRDLSSPRVYSPLRLKSLGLP
jgi:hypothetical protein